MSSRDNKLGWVVLFSSVAMSYAAHALHDKTTEWASDSQFIFYMISTSIGTGIVLTATIFAYAILAKSFQLQQLSFENGQYEFLCSFVFIFLAVASGFALVLGG